MSGNTLGTGKIEEAKHEHNPELDQSYWTEKDRTKQL